MLDHEDVSMTRDIISEGNVDNNVDCDMSDNQDASNQGDEDDDWQYDPSCDPLHMEEEANRLLTTNLTIDRPNSDLSLLLSLHIAALIEDDDVHPESLSREEISINTIPKLAAVGPNFLLPSVIENGSGSKLILRREGLWTWGIKKKAPGDGTDIMYSLSECWCGLVVDENDRQDTALIGRL